MIQRTILPLLLLAALPVCAQRLCVGVRAGLPLSDAFLALENRSASNLESKAYTFGPTVEVYLPHRVSFLVDALYRRAAYSTSTGSTFEFPVLARYTFKGSPAAHPFLGGGFSFQHLRGLKQFVTTLDPGSRSNTGFVLGGGVELRVPFLRISPEIRFTRWGVQNLRTAPLAQFRANQNQAVLLVGITF